MVQYHLSGPDQWMIVGACSVLFPGLMRKDSSDLGMRMISFDEVGIGMKQATIDTDVKLK